MTGTSRRGGRFRRVTRNVVAMVVVTALVLVAAPGHAAAAPGDPQLDWAGAAGGALFDRGRSIAVDAAGNTHITGSFEGTVDFDPGVGVTNLTSNGSTDIFVAGYDPTGNLIRAFNVGGNDSDRAEGIVVDAAGNTHITGYFQSTADFDPGPATTNLTSAGSFDIFVAVYDPTGNLIHAFNIGGSDQDAGRSIAVDAAGNTYITGSFIGTADFDPSAGVTNLTSNGASDIFVAAYDPAGNLMRAAGIGSTDFDRGAGIAVDAAGNTHITGSFRGTFDFDPSAGVVELASNGNSDIFVAVYDPTGNLIHAAGIGDSFSDEGNGIAVDAAGNTYVTGLFFGTVDFDPSAAVDTRTSNGNNDFFFALYDPAGNFVAGTNIGGTDNDEGNGVAVDAAGNIHLTGSFTGTVDFEPGAGVTNLTSIDGSDVFVAVYGPTGLRAHSIGGAGSDEGSGVAVDAAGNTYVTGSFTGTVDFDPGTATTNLAGGGFDDIFFARYSTEAAVSTATCDGLAVTIDMNLGASGTGTAADDVIFGTPGPDVIDGMGGDDTICGEGGDDNISGSAGVDFIFGGDGNDTMTGGDGNDRIRGQQGIDDISGGAGNDFLYGGIDGDSIVGGDGNDTIGGFGGADTIDGGPGNDRIFGGFGADIILGGDGNDKILGLVGNDLINGNAGDDELNGDNGQDTINGGTGNDTIRGGNSLDTLDGDDGDDNVAGGKSNDSLSGGAGNDTCAGNTGTDTADTTCETIFGVP